jgi:TatD DNase family protein
VNTDFTYFDVHTHKKYADSDVEFVRNAFHHLSILQLNNIPYHFSIGLHPWDVQLNNKASMEQLSKSATHPRCLAIGECGLDYYIKTDRQIQQSIFKELIQLAEQLGKPLIVHCVRAYHDLIPLIKNVEVPIILHQYTGSMEMTEALLKNPSVYFSFGKQLFHPHFDPAVFLLIPINRVFFESDNSPRHIEDVYEKAALLFDFDFESLQKQLKSNVAQVFSNR